MHMVRRRHAGACPAAAAARPPTHASPRPLILYTEDAAFPFNGGNGPIGAEGTPLASTVNASVVTAYQRDGYAYVGRIALVKDMEVTVPEPQPYSEPKPDEEGNLVMRTVRATPDGDVYVGR